MDSVYLDILKMLHILDNFQARKNEARLVHLQ